MSWRIVMIENGDTLKLRLDNLYVQRGDSKYNIPLSDISTVIISNLNTTISARLMDAFTQYNVVLMICDYKHHPSGFFIGLNTHSRSSKVLQTQLKWNQEFKDSVWFHIIYSKILNQHLVLQNKKQKDYNDILLNYLTELTLGDITNREGHAAKVYFNLLFGKNFTRDHDDIINACLDYGYTVIRGFFARLIVGYGFTGLIGVHHKNEYNDFNLVDDLMEPFRPFLDNYIITLLETENVFSFEMRYKIVDFFHIKIRYVNKNMLMINAIEKYVQGFVSYCRTNNIDDFQMPMISYE